MSDFLNWVATLNPFVQILIVVLVFLVVIAALLYFVEIAPRPGKIYTAARLAVCIVVPLLAMLVLGSVFWAAAIAAVLGGIFFILDYRAKAGSGYLFQLFGFLGPAIILLAIGLIYPSVKTIFDSFLSGRGNFVGLDNYVWIFTRPAALRTVLNTLVWVLVVPVKIGRASCRGRGYGE